MQLLWNVIKIIKCTWHVSTEIVLTFPADKIFLIFSFIFLRWDAIRKRTNILTFTFYINLAVLKYSWWFFSFRRYKHHAWFQIISMIQFLSISSVKSRLENYSKLIKVIINKEMIIKNAMSCTINIMKHI